MIDFKTYAISDEILKALDLLGYKSPTKVQQEVMPIILCGSDLIAKAQTGSGKTASFAIPICEEVDWEENKPQALILTPTRELAMQVKEDCFNIGRFKRIKVAALYGKAPFHIQQKELKAKCHMVVGTPGRVLDHLERGTFDCTQIRYIVIDEADEMFRMGFINEVGQILSHMPEHRQTMLFSATMPKRIEELCEAYMKEPIRVSIEREILKKEAIIEKVYEVAEDAKFDLLQDVLVTENPNSCMIFCNTKEQVDQVAKKLKALPCEKLHGGMEQRERFAVMEAFRKGQFRYLVATDVAARGIDIEHISHVVNYDLPEDKEQYVHRIGRTGRAGRKGVAISFVTPEDSNNRIAIEEYTKHKLPIVMPPSKEEVERNKAHFETQLAGPMEKPVAKAAHLNKEILKLHINAGKKTKMRPVDIVGTLCNLPNMTAQDIGIITIKDVSTFVEILNGKGEAVLKALQTVPIKGRMRKVSRVEEN